MQFSIVALSILAATAQAKKHEKRENSTVAAAPNATTGNATVPGNGTAAGGSSNGTTGGAAGNGTTGAGAGNGTGAAGGASASGSKSGGKNAGSIASVGVAAGLVGAAALLL